MIAYGVLHESEFCSFTVKDDDYLRFTLSAARELKLELESKYPTQTYTIVRLETAE